MNKQDLISKIKQLGGVTQEERSYLIELVNTKKKYGLVWEDKPETVEEQLRDNLPVLKEVKEKAIINNDVTLSAVEVPNHILIEGDNLHALTALTFTHEGKIDVIYIDPPYNTGNKDFKYNDSFVDKEDSYRHSKWLSFMDKRLRIAKRLLSETGVVFMSIDDNEISQLKLLCDEVFGEINFISQSTLVNNIAGRSDKKHIALSHEYVLIYQKTDKFISTGLELGENLLKEYKFKDQNGLYRVQGLRKRGTNSKREDRPNLFYPIYLNILTNTLKLEYEEGDIEIIPKLSDGSEGNWRWGKTTFLEKKDFLIAKVSNKKYEVFQKVYFESEGESKTTKMKSFLLDSDYTTDTATSNFKSIIDDVTFNNPKSIFLLQDLLRISTMNKNEIILDFFAGSGTTLNATIALNAKDGGNRQCILVTNNENNICEEVTYERNKRVIQGYTNAKSVAVEGLKNNNLRYFKSEFVPSSKTEQNKRLLTQASTELFCIKEDCYQDITSTEGFNSLHSSIFTNGIGKYLIVVYHSRQINAVCEQLTNYIKGLEISEKVRLYAFSPEKETLLEDFYDVQDKIYAVPLPEAIYNAYRATFRTLKLDKKPMVVITPNDDDVDGESTLFDNQDEE